VAANPIRPYVYAANRGSGNVSEYSIGPDGALTLIGTVSSGSGVGSGANWIACDEFGRFAYVTNSSDGTVSSFKVNRNTGLLASNGPDVSVGGPGANPIDVAIAPGNQFVCVANAGANSVSVFEIGANGQLSPVDTVALGANTAPWTIAFARKPAVPAGAGQPNIATAGF
jgi:6-phosphogluconolactonase